MPFYIIRALDLALPLSIIAIIDFLVLVVGYSILRLLRVSVNWVTWLLGAQLIIACIAFSLLLFVPAQYARFSRDGLMGGIAFGMAIHPTGQWVARRWYLLIKQRTLPWLERHARNLYLFMRKHHEFLGWIVFAASTAHGISYIFLLNHESLYELLTGLIAWIVLLALMGLGLLIEYNVKRKRLTKNYRWFHVGLVVVFFVLLLLHM